MHSKWVFKHFYPPAGKRNFFFVLLWVGGLLSGVLLCAHASYDSADTLYNAMHMKPSSLGLLLVCVLPTAFSAIAVYSPGFPIAYAVVFLSAITHGFSGTAIYLTVGDAAWILRPMLLFTGSCTSVLMWWLLLHRNANNRKTKPICFALCLSLLIYILDLFILTPFIGDITKVL